jgi:hypothetical protein
MNTPSNFVAASIQPTMRQFTAILSVLLLFACGRSTPEAQRWAKTDVAENGGFERSAAPAPALDIVPQDRKIIRTGDLRYEVTDLDIARAYILKQVTANGGYVEGDDRNDRGSSIDLTLRVRIPADRFDVFLADLNGLGDLLDQHISANDVTSQWVDVEARLAAKRKVEERFLAIVGQAKTVTEVLEVERELGNVRAEIESMEAQMKTLKDQVGMSTLTITCTKPQARINSYTPHFGSALRDGWNYFVRFVEAVIQLWPFLLLFGAIIIWLKRRRGAKK